jgi:CheY-like chemotaxis protein
MRPEPQSGAQGRPSVLLAEDEEVLRSVYQAALRHAGFTVRLARDGREALAVHRQHRGEIGMALLDVQMPELDGLYAWAALHQADPALRCCFLTGYSPRYSDKELLDLGAAGVLHKPFGLEELADTVRGLLGAPSQP